MTNTTNAASGTASHPTVFEAFGKVMAEVQGLGKHERNEQQRFNFRGIDAVYNVVGPVIRRHGLFAVPVRWTDMTRERYQSKAGGNMVATTAVITFRIYGPGGDHFDAELPTEAADSGDKGIAKAVSVGARQFWIHALSLPTDEPDPDSFTHERSAEDYFVPDEPGPLEKVFADFAEATDLDALKRAWAAASTVLGPRKDLNAAASARKAALQAAAALIDGAEDSQPVPTTAAVAVAL